MFRQAAVKKRLFLGRRRLESSGDAFTQHHGKESKRTENSGIDAGTGNGDSRFAERRKERHNAWMNTRASR